MSKKSPKPIPDFDFEIIEEDVKPIVKTKKLHIPLKICDDENENIIEIGIDECARGPLFGRVYVGAVILPRNTNIFDHSKMKDSKKFTSKNKKIIQGVAEYIKQNATEWVVEWNDESFIDRMGISYAIYDAMHRAVRKIITKLNLPDNELSKYVMLVDGDKFKPLIVRNSAGKSIAIRHKTIVGGDNLISSIAAASIIAKVDHDAYIQELCIKYPSLISMYSMNTHVGYGSAKHIAGINEYGITPYHRISYKRCDSAQRCLEFDWEGFDENRVKNTVSIIIEENEEN